MVREAVPRELTASTGFQRRYTVADGTAITKGTFLKLSDPYTASSHSAALDPCAGIAAMDKEASDGSTSISAWTSGIFEAYASGTITAGNAISLGSPANYVQAAVSASAASGSLIIGYALETATTGEVINIVLRL